MSTEPHPPPLAAPPLPEDVIVGHILTRVPGAAAVRFRAVCRAWRDALTSDHFVEAHRAARNGGAQPPEIVFFVPAPAAAPARSSNATSFYTWKLDLTARKRNDRPSSSSDENAVAASARELVTLGNLRATDLAVSATRPCRGLTLLYQPHPDAYHVCNLSTGEHVSLPPCAPAAPGYRFFYGPSASSAGLGFDPAAREHIVARLYSDGEDHQTTRCEVYGLRSGGWRPSAGQPPPQAASKWRTDMGGEPPVFVDGCFYWRIDTRAILSLAVGTEEFGLVDAPGRRPVREVRRLAELDGSLCAMVELEPRLSTRDETELWTRTAGGGSPPSWSIRCRISLYRLPWAIRNAVSRGHWMFPLATSVGGKILFATSCYKVYAYDPESRRMERVFSMEEFVDYPGEARVLLSIALHEDSVTGVCRRRPVAGDDDDEHLKVKHGSSTLARREGYYGDYIIHPKSLLRMIDRAVKQSN